MLDHDVPQPPPSRRRRGGSNRARVVGTKESRLSYSPSEPSASRQAIQELGFPAPVDVSAEYGIGGRYPNARERTGVYVLVLSDGPCYIGKATDVVRRFSQHRRTFKDRLVGFSFLQLPRKQLDDVEQRLIKFAGSIGLPLEQVDWTTIPVRASDLLEIVDEEEFEAWRHDPRRHLAQDQWPIFAPETGRRSRDLQSFRQLSKMQAGEEAIDVCAEFVQQCIPVPRRTAPDYWNVACLPSTNRSTSPRFLCVSAHVMETLVLGYSKHSPNETWGFLVCARSPLERTYGSLPKASRALCVTEVGERMYKSAGHDQCQLFVDSLSGIRRLLAAAPVREASQLLMQRVMQKGVNRYARFHCSALADRVLTISTSDLDKLPLS